MPEPAIPSGFSRIDQPDASLILLDRCRSPLLEFFAIPVDRWMDHPEARSHAGKGRHFSIPLPGGAGRAFVRRWTHGGGVRFLGRWFPGAARALRELEALARAREAGVPVPEPLAVRIERAAFGCRLTTLTRYVAAEGDLPTVLGAFGREGLPDAARTRRLLARRFGEAVGRLHRIGVHPEDLHLRNVLVVRCDDGPGICLVDLDPVRLEPVRTGGDAGPPIDAAARSLARLLRSCRRWARAGLRIGRTDRARFMSAYASAAHLDRSRAQALIGRVSGDAAASPRDTARDARGVVIRVAGGAPLPYPIRVQVRMPNWLGDAVMAMPLLEGARRAWPDAEISALVPAPLRDLVALTPVPVRIAGPGGLPASSGADIVISVPRSFGAAWRTSRAGGMTRTGWDGPCRRWLYTHRVRISAGSMPRHRVETLWALGAPFGFGPFPPAPRLVVPETDREAASRILAEAGIRPGETIVGLNPGAAYGPAKQWPADRFAETAKALAGRAGIRVVVFGAGPETALAERIAGDAGPAAVSLAGKTTLRTLAALIARCRVFVTNDSGPMHMAAALDVPVVALFGSTDPDATGPYGRGHRVVRVPTPCAPCMLRRCPIDFRCMRGIPVSRVVEATDQALSGASRVA